MKRHLLASLFVLAALTSLALADDVRSRSMGTVFRAGALHIYYSARDLVTAKVARELDSGLPQRIVVQHFVYAEGHGDPIAVGGHSCKVVYDLWQEVYRVEREILGGSPHAHAVRTRAEVLDQCLVMIDFPIGVASDYPHGRRGYVASLIQLNPLSTTTVARIRRWLARPRGEYNVESKSFFGSFVSLFVNDRIGAAERVLRLRSQSFELP